MKRRARVKNPRMVQFEMGLRYCPRCGLVTYGEGLPWCKGRVMWANTGGHVPVQTKWVEV